MRQNKASTEQLEYLVKEIVSKGSEPTFESVNEMLSKENSFVEESDFYKCLYSNHLYDWKIKESPSKIQAEKQSQERIGELERTLSQVKATLESTEDGILMLTREGKIVNFNQKFVQMFRFPSDILDVRNEPVALKYILDQVVDPQELFHTITLCYDDPTIKGEMGDLLFKDGRIFERYSQPHLVGDQIVGRVWSFRDVTGRRKQDQELRLRERAIQASTHGVLIIDNSVDHKILFVNPAFERITGYPMEEVLGENAFFWCDTDKQESSLQSLHLALKENTETQDTAPIHRKDGKLLWIEINIAPVPNNEGKITHFVWIVNDITERKLMEDRLEHQATHDALTGLPNRVLLRDRLQQAMLQAKLAGGLASVWFIDLDRFKLTNDSLGHGVGDELLKEVALRLSICIGETDTIARIGGDEFVIVSKLKRSGVEAIPLAQKILKKLAEPIQLDNRTFNITASIGISTYPENGSDIETLMKNADIAMYRAKDLGRDNFQFFTAEMNEQLSKRLMLENALHIALDNDELSLHYQPLIDINTDEIIGFEALLRWHHPEKGMIPPIEFIPVAEDSGLIISIGEWVLKKACLDHKILNSYAKNKIYISINVSSQQLKKSDFVKTVEKILNETEISPEFIQLELTESILIENSNKILEMLDELKNKGIKLVIDDFGTGYSSLSYLRRFPLDKIKVDKSFVSKIPENRNDSSIVQTIIVMGHLLGLKVLAEGVETKAQLDFLREHGCDEMQGYFFSRPISLAEMIKLLDSGRNLKSLL